MKVCWISNIPSPYKVDFMNLLGKEVELTCLFEHHQEVGRDESWYKDSFNSFKAVFLEKGLNFRVLNQMAKENDILLNSDYSNPICMLATELFKLHKKKVIIQADGGLVIPRGIVDKVISITMKRADAYLSSGVETNKYFAYYGVDTNKCHLYPISSLSNEDIEKHALLVKNKALYKKELFTEEFVLLSVGQQIPRKGYDVLAKAVINLPKNIGLYIVGGKPEENVKQIVDDNNLSNVHFIDFMSKDELSKYYAGSDVFVLPTRYDIWGLVINEAMSFGLPIISTDHCVAAMEMVNQFDNGVICPIEDSDSLSKAILKLYQEKELSDKMSNASLEGNKNYSIELMVKSYVELFHELMK
ncbi:MAG: glycosyltransferase family 4 protein [Erysipelotrichaceae bacterium]|nr:glycosyltransferase family 4 protein [Erysipelotrichaceae bacterium]